MMPKTKKITDDQKNKNLCRGCDACCRYVITEIDKPTDKSDFDNITWFLHHKNVNVYIGHDNKWYLEFVTPCEQLGSSKLCKIYEKRPQICRKYKQADCPKYNDDTVEKHYFKCAQELDDYMQKKKISFA